MSSTIVADSTEDKDDSLIIIVNADGTITVDPETLQKLIENSGRKSGESLVVVLNADGTITVDPDKLLNSANNHSNNVSLVHVNDPEPNDGRQNSGDTSQINLTVEGFFPPNRTSPNHTLLQDLSDADPGNDVSDPFSHLEPEHLARLESALQSEHAKEILGSKLDDNLTNMLNILEGNDDRPSNNISPDDCHSYSAPPDVHVDHSYHVQPVPAVLHQQSSTVMANKQPPQLAPSRLPASRQLLSGPRVRGRPTRGLRTLGGIARTIIPGQLQTGVITSSVSNQEVSSTKYVVNPGSRPTQVRTLTPVPGTRTLAWLPPRRVPPTSGSQAPLTSVNSSGAALGPSPRASVPIQSPPRKVTTQPSGNISPAPVVSSTTDQKIPVLKKTVSQAVSIPTKIPTTTKAPPKSAAPTLAGPTSAHAAATIKTTPVLVQKKLTVIKKKPDTPIVENEVTNAQAEPEEVAAAAISCKLFRRLPNSRRSRMSMASKLVGATFRGGKINRRGIVGRGGIVRRKERPQKMGEPEEKVSLAESDATSEEVNSETSTESKVPEIAFPPAPKEVDLSNVTVSPSIMALIQKKTPHVVLTKLENLPGNQITALKSALSEEDLASAPQDQASKPSQSLQPSKASSETLTPSLSTSTTTAAPETPLEKSKEDLPLDKVAPLEKNTLSTDSKPVISSVKVSTPANIKTAKSPKKLISKDVKPASTSEGKKTESPKVSTVRLKTLKEPAPVKGVNIQTPNSTPAKVGATTKSEKAILDEKDKEKKKKEKAKSLTTGPVVLGPELFSTPDIIRRVSTDKPSSLENVTPEKEHPVERRNSLDSDPTPIDTPILTSKESEQTMVASQDNMLVEGAVSDQAQPDNVSKEAVAVKLDSSLVKSQPDSLLNAQPIVTSSTNRKVEVQLVHPPLSGDPITATETLLHNIHSDTAKRDSALLLDDLTNDGVSPMKFEEDVQKVESQTIVTSLNSPLPNVKPSPSTNAQVVVQADGNDRLRRLPPIEVPTTRSATKKAALGSSPQLPKSPIKKPTQPKVVLLANEQKVEMVEPITEHRASTESHLSTNSVEKKPILSDSWDSEMDDHGSDVESYNSEDDPNRLWCICQKPHNNRFMICCDGCEDWFHGKCVGITKALGQQMEAQGVEWSCPNCRAAKAKEAQRQNPSKIGVKSPGLNQSTLGSLECITCKKPAKVASNFCSDNCIKKHAVTKITALKKEVPSLCLISKVTVYNKATGKVIVGEKAPTVQKLADWLLTNSGYEVLTPSMSTSSKFGQLFDYNSGSQSEGQPSPKVVVRQPEKSGKPSEKPAKIEKRGSVGSISSQSSVVNKKIEATSSTDAHKEQAVLKQAVLMPKVVKGEIKVGFGSKPGPASKKIQLIQAQPLTPLQIEGPPKTKGKTEDGGKKVLKASTSVPQTSSPTVEKKKEELKAKKERKPKEIDTKLVASGTSSKSVNSPVVKTPSTPTLASPPTTPLPSKEKTATSTDKVKEKVATPASEKEETPKQESIRDNVKRMLQETLSQRTSQDPELKTTIEEIRSLVEAIEEELYNFFKDTGVKYRAKFRSLIFNIKDAKNHTLYKKIVEKAVQPSELVRLSPEELASQELAQWREKEAKHQIEMIKKNELALIHQAKTVVLKSRKGEEIIESKNHEANISELESALNRTADDYEEPAVGTKKELDTSILNFSLLNKEKNEKKESEKKEKDRGRKKERKRSHRSRSRGRRRSQSKSKERSHRSTGSSKDGSKRSRSQSQEKSNKKGRSRSKSRTSSKSHGRSRSKSRERTGESKTRNESKSRERSKSRGRSKTRTRSKTRERPKTVSERSQGSADVGEHTSENSATSLIDDIGGSLTPPPPVFGSSSDYKSLRDDDLSDREPSSTVFIATPPTPEEKPAVWTGTLNMSEVTALFASAYEVSGSCEDLEFELSDTLECIGRIQPDSVWEYVSRMKKAGTKDIIVIRFQAESELEKINYVSLYSYLSTRNRMAVIGHIFKTVKDFYVMPLASHSPIPQVLLPLDGPGFEETRPHLLLGIIVRNRKGVYGSVPSYGLNSSAPVSKKRHSASTSAAVSSERSYTPPLPDSASGAVTPHKVVPPPLPPVSLSPEQEQEDDEEQPYDPGEGQEDIGDQDDEPYSPSSQHTPDIAKNLEEVKKLIEEKKQKIEALIPTIPGIGDTPPPYSSDLTLNVGEDEAYSPPESFTPPPVTSDNSVPFFNTKTLPDIKLPSNLQEILASIKGPQMDPKLDPIVKAYTSQKNLNEEEGSITDDESEKSSSMASDTSHSKSRDPRQRVTKPTSLGQFSDSDLLKKAAEMEYITSGGSGPPPSQVVDSPCAPPNNFYAVPPPPVPPYPPPLPPGMGPFQKAMGGPPGIGMPPILGVQGVPVPPPLPHLPPGHPTGVVPPALKRPQMHFLEGPPQMDGNPPMIDPATRQQLRDMDMRGPGPPLPNWPPEHHSHRSGNAYRREARDTDYRRGNFPYRGGNFDRRSGNGRNAERIPPPPNRIQNEWDEEIRNFEQRRARESGRRKRIRSRSPSSPHRRHRRHGRPSSPSNL